MLKPLKTKNMREALTRICKEPIHTRVADDDSWWSVFSSVELLIRIDPFHDQMIILKKKKKNINETNS